MGPLIVCLGEVLLKPPIIYSKLGNHTVFDCQKMLILSCLKETSRLVDMNVMRVLDALILNMIVKRCSTVMTAFAA